jgi:adenylate kinase
MVVTRREGSAMPEPVFRAVLLFGAPGVGKGTQGQRLGRVPRFHHLSTGDMFRSLDKDSPLGKEVRSFTERGVLVPDELTVRIFRDAVHQRVAAGKYDPARDTLVLDGIPRNVNQCRILEREIRVVRVLHLVSSDPEVMVTRMKKRAVLEGRKDDADEAVIRRRFDVYCRETAPVLEYYPANLVLEIDALGTPDEVAAAIERGLKGK